ncbi:MAG: GDSL-type esterase/lipase family protein [Opitutaceae bacterium]
MRSLLFAASLAAAIMAPAGAATGILFLGDSITQGIGGQGSYRDPLIRLLRGENIGDANPEGTAYDFAVLGSMTLPLDQADNSAYPDSLALFPNHEGHSGWSADYILNGHPAPAPASGSGKLIDWLSAYPQLPGLVLLHIGSNDVLGETVDAGFVDRTRAEVRTILDTLKAANPNVVVFLAKIIPLAFTNPVERRHWVAAVDAINTSAALIAAESNAAAGAPWVHVADQNTGFDPATMMTSDGHPNEAGEAFIAASWFRSMKWFLDGESAPPPESSEAVRVVSIGDIVTQGGNGQASYRAPLLQLLAGENIAGANPGGRSFNVRFAGSHRTTYDFSPWIADYPPALAQQPLHEGHAGWTTRQMIDGVPGAGIQTGAGKLSDWLQGYTADIALVHLGSDDSRAQTGSPQPDFASRARENIAAVIKALRADNPNIVVLLAKPIPNLYWSDALNEAAALIDDLADDINAAAPQPFVIVVDQNTGFDPATMLAGDGLLPNDTGEAFMAARWFEALLPVLDGAYDPPANSSAVVNLSSRAFVGTGSEVVIPGFVISGAGSKTLLVRGIGPTLGSDFGVAGALASPALTLFSDNQPVATNIGWSTSPDAAAIAQAAETAGAFPLPANSADSAMLVALEPGSYTVSISGVDNTTGVGLMEIYDADGKDSAATLDNLSTRARVGAGSEALILGYAISGATPKRLLVRAIGPGLAGFGVTDALPDPTLTVLEAAGVEVATNNNWGEAANLPALQEAMQKAGAFEIADGSLDAAAVVELAPGSCTVRVSGAANATGVALVEIYVLE